MNVLYTTGCPKCHILESKLNEKKIGYTRIEGDEAIDGIEALGFMTAPLLVVDGKAMEFGTAVKWVNER